MKTSRISTERLLLRKPVSADLRSYYAIHSDPEANRFNPSGPVVSTEQAKKALRHLCRHWQKHGFGYWMVASQERPTFVIGCGGIMMKQIDGVERPNLYFRFRPSAWGHGYAFEMGTEARKLAFESLKMTEIAATVRPRNAPSIRLLEKLGLKRYTRFNDPHGLTLVYLLRNESFHFRPLR